MTDTEVVTDEVGETVVNIEETTTTILETRLGLEVGTVDGDTLIEVGPPEATEVQVEDSRTTIVDLFGGPQGKPGPTGVSADDYNAAYLGTDGLLYVPEKATMPLDLEIDESDSVALGYVYVGEAPPGTAPGDAAWRIKRIYDTGTTTTIDWAGGTADSTHIWDDHKTLEYGP